MKNRVITISREFGSGGRTIGKKVAEKLGIPCYDAQLLHEIAKESGFDENYIKDAGEYAPGGYISNAFSNRMFGPTNADYLWDIQYNLISELAEKGPCVIVGRCADYILSTSDEIDQKDLFNVFIYGDIDEKLKRIEELYKETESAAKKTILQIDKRRANHYNTFTENTWGDRKNYDLMINSSTAGIDTTAVIITEIVKNS